MSRQVELIEIEMFLIRNIQAIRNINANDVNENVYIKNSLSRSNRLAQQYYKDLIKREAFISNLNKYEQRPYTDALTNLNYFINTSSSMLSITEYKDEFKLKKHILLALISFVIFLFLIK